MWVLLKSIFVAGLLELHKELTSTGFSPPGGRQSISLPHRLQVSSSEQRLLILIFPCHAITAATRQDNREAKESKQIKENKLPVSKSSAHKPRRSFVYNTDYLQHRATWCWVFLELMELFLPVHRTQQLQESGWEEVFCQGTAVLGFLPLNIPTLKESVKIRLGLE